MTGATTKASLFSTGVADQKRNDITTKMAKELHLYHHHGGGVAMAMVIYVDETIAIVCDDLMRTQKRTSNH